MKHDLGCTDEWMDDILGERGLCNSYGHLFF